MTKLLKQSTAASVVVGPFLDYTDAVTSEESFTSLSGVMYKEAGASTSVNPSASHTASGMYHLDLVSGCSDTLGLFKLHFANSASHLPVWEDYIVVPANTYDSLVGGTDRIDAELAASGIVASTFDAGAIDAAAIAVDFANKVADHIIRRAASAVEASSDGDAIGFRSLLGAIAKNTNLLDASGSALEIFRTDDATLLGTQTITSSSSASPIVTIDTD